jgi:hypothetical protein
MKIAIVSLLAVIATALVIIAGYIGYKAHRENRIRIASEIGMSTPTTRALKRLAEMSRDAAQHLHCVL